MCYTSSKPTQGPHGLKKTAHHSPSAPKSWANLIPGAGAKGGGTAGAGASDAASPPGPSPNETLMAAFE